MDTVMEELSHSSATKVVQPLTPPRAPGLPVPSKLLPIAGVAIVLGLLTGYGLYHFAGQGTPGVNAPVQVVKTANEEGVKDASTFKDTATGTMQTNDGKITTEGTDILIRGDASQNVYLTSSVIDLSKYTGKKVQVWGETYKGQTAGWLMDVGRIKVL